MGPEGHDLRRDQGAGGSVPPQQRQHPQLQGWTPLREPSYLCQTATQLHEVVVRLLHRVTDEVVDDVAHLDQVPARCDWAFEVLAVGDVAHRVD